MMLIRKHPYRCLFLVLPILGGAVYSETPSMPAYWVVSSQHAGEGERNYVGVLDNAICHSGSASGLLRSKTFDPTVSGTLMQAARADSYRGKKIRFSAYLKSQDVAGWAGIWFRADDASGDVVAFQTPKTLRTSDNEPISGSVEWHEVNIVIDIPESAAAIFYGVQLIGQGSVWIDDADIEELAEAGSIAAKSFPTAFHHAPPVLDRLGNPTNLDFEQ